METPSYVQALLTGHSFNKNMRCMETVLEARIAIGLLCLIRTWDVWKRFPSSLALDMHSFNKNMRCMETKVLVSYIVTVNADTPTQAPFFPLYYTKMISRNLEWLLPA